MVIKAIIVDTSTPWLYLALAIKNKNKWSLENYNLIKTPENNDAWLSDYFSEFLKIHNIKVPDLVFLGKGPGSFTGLRISFSYFRTYCMLMGLGLCLFSSIEFWHRSFSDPLNDIFLVKNNRTTYYGHFLSINKKLKFIAEKLNFWQKKAIKLKKRIILWPSIYVINEDYSINDNFKILTIDEADVSKVNLLPLDNLTNQEINWQAALPHYGHELTFNKNL